jgi:hypothetical protein
MSELTKYAIPLSRLRSGYGFPDNTEFIVLSIAENILNDYKKAARILIDENNKWAKELELTRNENIKLKTGHYP